ncbi:Insertion element protein [Synechococcus sp. PCC 7335]|nr:Insertion element protein [Synechococcus sp. PCC 7335]EDX83193.1 Insertion element protein [Synechococcus sp. PCC 7335]
MDCPFCDHPTPHKHGKTSKGSQRYRCTACRRTFTETFDTLYDRRQVTSEQVKLILQTYVEGSSLRGISRIGKRAYGTVVDIVR